MQSYGYDYDGSDSPSSSGMSAALTATSINRNARGNDPVKSNPRVQITRRKGQPQKKPQVSDTIADSGGNTITDRPHQSGKGTAKEQTSPSPRKKSTAPGDQNPIIIDTDTPQRKRKSKSNAEPTASTKNTRKSASTGRKKSPKRRIPDWLYYVLGGLCIGALILIIMKLTKFGPFHESADAQATKSAVTQRFHCDASTRFWLPERNPSKSRQI